jgi:hypothetical protein
LYAVSVPRLAVDSLGDSISFPFRKNLDKDTLNEYKLQHILSATANPCALSEIDLQLPKFERFQHPNRPEAVRQNTLVYSKLPT